MLVGKKSVASLARSFGGIRAKKKKLLLDLYPGAAVAFSTRKVRTDYSGPCMRVRHSVTNVEYDIGFVNGWLDEASLLTVIGSNDAFVVTWYDQSSNARHATQAVASQQPTLVTGGSIEKFNGKPILNGNRTQTSLDFDGTFLANSLYLVTAIASRTSAMNNQWIFGGTETNNNRNLHVGWYSSTAFRAGQYGNDVDVAVPAFVTERLELCSTSLSSSGRDGKIGSLSNSTVNTTRLASYNGAGLFRQRTTFSNNKISEVVIYASDKTAERAAIEGNQMTAFGVTP